MDKKPPAKSQREVVLEKVRQDIANNHWPRLKRPPNQNLVEYPIPEERLGYTGDPETCGTYTPPAPYRVRPVLRLVQSRPKVTDGKEE